MTCKFPQNKPSTGYTKGCRCDRCVAGNKKIKEEWRAKYYATTEGNKVRIDRQTKYRANHPLRPRHTNMIDRCSKPHHPDFKNWGGRGITVCEEWKDFATYETYVMSLPNYDPSLQLDRIDNDGNYEPGNVRWVTRKENCNNRKRREV